MKKRVTAIIFLAVLLMPIASAYSISNFFEDVEDFFKGFSITGMAILEVAEKATEAISESKEPLSPPEPKKVEAKEIVEKPKEEPSKKLEIVETIDKEITTKEEIVEPTKEESVEPEEESVAETSKQSTSSSSGGSSTKSINHMPSCSDFIDNNINYFKKGTCKDDRGKFMNNAYPTDYCSADKTLVMEFSCGKTDSCDSAWHVCPNGCEDGACIIEETMNESEKLQADLKILSVKENNCQIKTEIKNVGTKSTDFKLNFTSNGIEETLNVDYVLQPGEIIEVDLTGQCITSDLEYSLEIINEEDKNNEDNIKLGVLELSPETKAPIGQEITGKVTLEQDEKRENLFNTIINFIKRLF
ncbi:hypothetical protein HOA59_02490 [archaeon]|jgi:hypothetical protein|nr:hypothetical protein [archaeon]MBT6824280.1 hypothetical protein [archaeon]MBT7107358.1 hypothetical protein [archaeon]MBT7297324.1 hypothetical protein [archaeon]